MKKLFITTALLIFFMNANSQENFNGNWKPTSKKGWEDLGYDTEEIYIKNFNIFSKNINITSYLTERDYIEYSYNNPEKVFNKNAFKERTDLKEEILFSDEKNIKTLFTSTKTNYQVYINYYLKTKKQIVATYINIDTNKIKGIVTYKRKK
tara:strand:+ start:2249 stop:2701 length:453 start_codon:yes stop_codon:yes gene_type:complete